MILATFQSLTEIHSLQFLHILPVSLMIVYISNKSANRNHLLPKLIRLGLIVSAVGDIILFCDSGRAGNILGAVCYLVGMAVYVVGMNIGENVRYLGVLGRFGIRMLALVVLIGQIMWQYTNFDTQQ